MPRLVPAGLLAFLLLLLQGLAFGQQQQRLSSAVELAALYSLRSSLGLRSRDWPRKTDPCTGWAGVFCQTGRVIGLDVSGLRRTRNGRQNPRFAVDGLRNLTGLASFNASGFALPGPIPEWFGSRLPPSFAILDLRFCGINGTLPASLGNLLGLRILALSGNFLFGGIPPDMGRLRNLEMLGLARNALSGPVPPSLGNLSSLRDLDLSTNSFSGVLPDELSNLRSLQVLNLGNNSLAGTLSDNLVSGFPKLRFFTLSHNNFSSTLPDLLWSLGELRFLDVSYNNLTGEFPEAAANINAADAVFNFSHNNFYGPLPPGVEKLFRIVRILDISDNYFEGTVPLESSANASVKFNCLMNTANQKSIADCAKFYADRGLIFDGSVPPSPPQPRSLSKKNLIYILVGVIGGMLFLAVVILLLVFCYKKSRARAGATTRRRSEGRSNVLPSVDPAPPSVVSTKFSAVGDSFTYEQLMKATSDFSDGNLMKHGHSGDFYHGTLASGAAVVVKRVDVRTVRKELHIVELDFFARASHTRLVPFLGHCLENENEKLLVYKFMPNGDLSNALYRKMGQEEGLQSLDWITRLKIAIGVAEALCFLHHECTPPIVHKDVQASSILLDDKFEVRLGSLSEVCTQESDGHPNVFTRFLRLSQSSEPGTSGSQSATCAFDVYCLGKVLLELVTGKLGISGSNDPAANEWLDQTLHCINIYEKELLTKILDPSLIVDEDLMEEVWAMAIVAKSCLNPKPSKRPQVRYVLKALENPLKVVREDHVSNSARLRATSSRGSWNAALFGSWRSTSDVASASGPPREMATLKRSGTVGSQGSVGEQSFNHRRPSKEVFPEPSSGFRGIDD